MYRRVIVLAVAAVTLAACQGGQTASPRARAASVPRPGGNAVEQAATRPTTAPSGLSADESLYEAAFRFLLGHRQIGEDCVLVLTENDAEVPIPARVIRRLADTGVPFATTDQVNLPAGDAVDEFASDEPGHRLAVLHVAVLARPDDASAKVELAIIRGPGAVSPKETVIARRGEGGAWGFAPAGR